MWILPHSTLTLDSLGNLLPQHSMAAPTRRGPCTNSRPVLTDGKTGAPFSFDGKDGDGPYSGVIFSYMQGNIYGTTAFGGAHGSGTVYELKLSTKGVWKETVVHNFGSVGKTPQGNIVFTRTETCMEQRSMAESTARGLVRELSPNGKGGWVSKTLHTFAAGSD